MNARRYQDQDSPLTLREGLAEYQSANPELVDPAQSSDAGAAFFQSHDACHVVFGTTTAILDEATTDYWTIFGVAITLRQYAAQFFGSQEGQDLMKTFGWRMILVEGLRTLPRFFTVWARARRMTRKWPWIGFERYLDMPLGELRREFGIRVF